MPYNSETETFYQAPATVVDSTPDGDTVQEGFDDRLTPALAGVYADFNLLKADGMISVGIPATTTARGICRVATSADLVDGATINNGPAFLAAGVHTSVAAAAGKVPVADASGKVPEWAFDVGDLVPSFAASKSGFLLCNGGAYSRTTYSALFAILGTSFGAGNGSTTFNVPDFRGRTIQGASANLKAVLAAGLPDIQATGGSVEFLSRNSTGAFYNVGSTSDATYGSNATKSFACLGFKASLYNAIYGNSTTVQPPAIAANIFIKY